MFTISVKRGNPYSAILTFTNEDGTAYDLTGKTVFFTVKKATDNTTNDDLALIKKDITSHTSASEGKTTLELTAKETNIVVNNYKWDLRVSEMNTDTGVFCILETTTKRTE